MKNKYYVSWEDVIDWIYKIEIEYRDYLVFGVPKGGLILAGCFKNLPTIFYDLDFYYNHNEIDKILIVDDIVDSGKTKKKWLDKYPNAEFEALIDKQNNKEHKKLGYVVFPWENDKIDIDENIDRMIQYYDKWNCIKRDDFKKYIVKYFEDFMI